MTEVVNAWYIPANGGTAFTSDPKQAKVDLTGAPMLATGTLIRILEQRKEVHMRLLDQLWEKLLDKMEEYYTASEKVTDLAYQPLSYQAAELREDKDRLKWEIVGYHNSLAIMEYGHLYQDDPDAAINRIKQTARQKYDQ